MEVDANKVTKLCANLWPYVSEFCGTLGSLVVQTGAAFPALDLTGSSGSILCEVAVMFVEIVDNRKAFLFLCVIYRY